MSASLVDQLEQLLRALASRRSVKHAVMAVERGDGSFRWSAAAGLAHPGGTPMRAETPDFIASVTKLYVATLVLRLHEQRRLALDTPIVALLPARLVGGLHSCASSRAAWRHVDRDVHLRAAARPFGSRAAKSLFVGAPHGSGGSESRVACAELESGGCGHRLRSPAWRRTHEPRSRPCFGYARHMVLGVFGMAMVGCLFAVVAGLVIMKLLGLL